MFNLNGILSLNTRGFTSGISRAEESTRGLDRSMGRLALGVGSFLGLTVGIKSAADMFVGFEKSMSNVAAITEASGQDLDMLSLKAREMGKILPASASDAADAMANLGSAGFNTNEIMDSVEGTLYLAASAQTDMATAADISASTLRGFGLEANKANHVSDVMAKTASATNAGIIDLGEAMKYAAPVAHSMGISMEETSSAIGIMANAGIKGSQAGTTLRGALTRLTKPAKPARDLMQEIGFSAFDSSGKMKNLATITGELAQKTSGMTEEQRAAAYATIFGQEALSGMLALAGAGPDEINKLTTAFQNSDGAAKKMAETQTNNVYGAIESIKGAFEDAAIGIGESASPTIMQSLKGIADAIPGVANALVGLTTFLIQNKDIITSIGISYLTYKGIMIGIKAAEIAFNAIMAVKNAILLVGRARYAAYVAMQLGASKATAIATGAQILFNAAMNANPVGLVVTGLALLVGGVVLAYKKFKWFRDLVNGIWGTLKGFAKTIGKVFKGMGDVENKSKTTKEAVKGVGGAAPKKKNANGTAYFTGGLTAINERGGEIASLPNGTTIIPADRSKEMAQASGKSGNTINITVNATGLSVDELVSKLELRLANI